MGKCGCGCFLRACGWAMSMVSDRFTYMRAGWAYYRPRWLCRATVVLLTVCLALVGAACGDPQPVRESMLQGRLSGSVMLCPRDFRKCVNAVATVSVLTVHQNMLGNVVAQQRTRNGRFSFLLAPGEYFPSASLVQTRLHGGNCIAGDVTVHANKKVSDVVRCYVRAQVTR